MFSDLWRPIHVALALHTLFCPIGHVFLFEQILFLLLYFAVYLNAWYGKFLFLIPSFFEADFFMHRLLFLYVNFRIIIFCSRKIQLKFSVLHVGLIWDWINILNVKSSHQWAGNFSPRLNHLLRCLLEVWHLLHWSSVNYWWKQLLGIL